MNTYEWPTPDTARALWRDMPADDVAAQSYLDVATIQCLDYAPLELEDDETEIPANYFLAIVTQARNLFNADAAPRANSDDYDGSGYGTRTYPLDWTVKAMLRPEVGLGALV